MRTDMWRPQYVRVLAMAKKAGAAAATFEDISGC